MELAEIIKWYKKVSSKYDELDFYKNKLNLFWGGDNLAIMREIIYKSINKSQIIESAQKTFMFSVNVGDDSAAFAVEWLLSEQLNRGIDIFEYSSLLQESEFSYKKNNIVKNKRIFTPDFLRTFNIGLNIKKYLLDEKNSKTTKTRELDKLKVIELGAGLGHLARTIRLLGLSKTHIIIDLPETLVFSSCFLTENFPEAKMLWIDDSTIIKDGLEYYDFVFIPTLFAEQVLGYEYDLFINTASMGEMRNDEVRHWMDFVQNRLTIKNLYTLNRYLNTIDPIVHEWRLGENEASVRYDKKWKILKWELEPSFTRCPFVDPKIARYVEIIASRLEKYSEDDDKQRSINLLEYVSKQDWVREAHMPAVMTARSNSLTHDLTMTGTLFMLWESLRLNLSIDGIILMLKYLDILLQNESLEFEETYYYENLFKINFAHIASPELDAFISERSARWKKRILSRPRIKLIESKDEYNILQVNESYVGVKKSLGKIDILQETVGLRDFPPYIYVSESIAELNRKIQISPLSKNLAKY